MKYFHASPRRIHIGDRIMAGVVSPLSCYDEAPARGGWVYLTGKPSLHCTIGGRPGTWNIYQVTPVGAVWRGDCNDFCCEAADVIRYIGVAHSRWFSIDKKRPYREGPNIVDGGLMREAERRKWASGKKIKWVFSAD